VISWKIEIYEHHNMYIVHTWRERKPECVAQGWGEMKEAGDSGTTMNTALRPESKDTYSLHNMLALGKISLHLGIPRVQWWEAILISS
jgi:hypothetical protein